MAVEFSWLGLDALSAKLRRIARPDPSWLLQRWELLVIEDNRAGVLAGTDCHGNPMTPVTYRPTQKATRGEAARLAADPKARAEARRNASGRYRAGATINKPNGMLGKRSKPMRGSANDNHTPAEYRNATGPPLAPFGESSRVIANLRTDQIDMGNGRWVVEAEWHNILSRKGRAFIHAHFIPLIGLPQRDLRGIRPAGMAKISGALSQWIRGTLLSEK